jgi:hypothetical protein
MSRHRLVLSLSSLRLTVALLSYSMVLIFIATIAQVHLGIHEVVKTFFRAWIAWYDVMPGASTIEVPLPGGALVGTSLIINLLAAHGLRFRKTKMGMLLIHLGILILLLGEVFTVIMGKEAQMTIDEGGIVNYSTFPREVELALIEQDDPGTETVHAIPQSRLKSGATFAFTGFSMRIDRYFANSDILEEAIADHHMDPMRATTGAGVGYSVRGKPRETAMNRRDLSSAFVTIIRNGQTTSERWLLTNAMMTPQEFRVGNKSWKMIIRQARLYHPFSIKLIDFRHDRYLGTNVPKNFSSKIRVMNPDTGEDREDLIYMNHPLRYQGLTFYQADFDNNDTTTIFQVVKNPAWILPYLSCTMVTAGLLWVFASRLRHALSRRATSTAT